jgi:hypothetical protein
VLPSCSGRNADCVTNTSTASTSMGAGEMVDYTVESERLNTSEARGKVVVEIS